MKKYIITHTEFVIYTSMLFVFIAINLSQDYLDLHTSNILMVSILIFSSFLFPKIIGKTNSYIQYKVLIVFFFLRILFSISTPLFEDDFYRYVVEGQIINQDINPYIVSPMEFGMIYTMQEGRIFSGDNLYHYINKTGFATLSAIYPPIIITIFRIIDNPVSLGFLFIISECLLLFLLVLYISKYSPNYFQNIKLICCWYIHPLVLYEGFLNKHYDIWIGLLILASLIFYNDHKNKIQSIFFAIAIHLKGYSLIYLPFFKHSRWKVLSIWLTLELLSYLWYPARFLKKSSLNTFINQWEFNNGLFTYLRIYLEEIVPLEQALLYTRVVFLLIFIVLFLALYYKWHYQQIKSHSFILMSVLFFICSPVANPWYFLMAVPFYINYCQQESPHYFLSILSFYYLFYIGAAPLESLSLITGLTWFVLFLLISKRKFFKIKSSINISSKR